jgi:hypothetical protein
MVGKDLASFSFSREKTFCPQGLFLRFSPLFLVSVFASLSPSDLSLFPGLLPLLLSTRPPGSTFRSGRGFPLVPGPLSSSSLEQGGVRLAQFLVQPPRFLLDDLVMMAE